MFIHLGENIVIQMKEIIAIVNKDLVKESAMLSEFVEVNMKKNNIVTISNGTVKSIVITESKVYFSPLSTVSLKKRSQYASELETKNE
ncbi:MAG TPA: DUF370 domain-containing protein [Bacillus bacterium]|nr:DUF370 domain-containing protein [Bacillus sp. (in: firmicutes)]